MFSSSKQQKPSLSVSSSSSSSSVVVTFDLPNSLLSDSVTTSLYKDDELFESTNNLDYDDHDDHDEHDDTHYPLKLSSDHNNSNTLYGNFIGLRERTTSQTSVEGRDRTMSQNSVEQLESQQQHQKSSSALLSTVSNNNTYNYRRLFGRSYNTTSTTNSNNKTLINNRKYISNTPTASNVTSSSLQHQQQRQQQYQWLRITIQYIQSIRVPIWLLRQCYGKQQQFYNPISKDENTTTTTESSNNNSITGSDIQQQDVYFISGLDHVFFRKESCCADDIRIMNWKPPRYMWYMISGAICDIIQLCILYILHLYIYDSSLCWMIAFCSSIVFRHTCHRYFVFGNYIGGYTKSLLRMYAGYSVTIVLSTILNFILNHIFIVNIFILALLTMAWTGIVNYFILKYFWNIGNHNKKSTTITSSTTTTGNINLQKSDTTKQLQQQSSPPSHNTTKNAVSFAIKS